MASRSDCLDAVLSRSQNVPLTIEVADNLTLSYAFGFMQPLRRRFRRLTWNLERAIGDESWDEMGAPFPNITTLNLLIPSGELESSLPVRTLAQTFPNLRSLRLDGYELSIVDDQMWFSGVTHLALKNMEGYWHEEDEDIIPNIEPRVLMSFPCLQELEIDHAGTVLSRVNDGPGTLVPFTLSHLRRFDIRGTFAGLLSPLQTFQWPPEATVSIVYNFPCSWRERDFRDIGQLISSKYQVAHASPRSECVNLHCLLLSIDYQAPFIRFIWTTSERFSFEPDKPANKVAVTLQPYPEATAVEVARLKYADIILSFCKDLMLLDDVRSLSMAISDWGDCHDEEDKNAVDLSPMLGKMKRLHSLAIRRTGMDILLGYLGCNLRQSEVVLPALQHLLLEAVDFAAHERTTRKKLPLSQAEYLQAILQRRKARGIPLRTLTLSKCKNILDQELEDLRALVNVVVM